jgi:hypothetical protein
MAKRSALDAEAEIRALEMDELETISGALLPARANGNGQQSRPELEEVSFVFHTIV